MSWRSYAESELHSLKNANRLRTLIAFEGDGPEGLVAGRRVVSFASNDYLGLASHPRVREAARQAIDNFGAGALAARLVVGTRGLHHDLERAIAAWKGTESALVFSTGYMANIGVLATLGAEDVTIFSDERNHASIIDGCRLAKARKQIFRHLDLGHLNEQLAKTSGRKIVVSESVFSMDGDRAPIDDLAQLCVRHGALLVLDDAHSVLEELHGESKNLECLHVGTLSKTLGSLGGFVAGPRALIELLVNQARTFIFTTALSPADTAAALAAMQVLSSEEGTRLRKQLQANVFAVKSAHRSPIVPIVLGSDLAALTASQQLFDRGLYVPAIRPPTVAEGTARLRVALSAAHTPSMIAQLRGALAELKLS